MAERIENRFGIENVLKALHEKPDKARGPFRELHYFTMGISHDEKGREFMHSGGDVSTDYNLIGDDGKVSALGFLSADAPGNIGLKNIESHAAYIYALFHKAINNQLHDLETEVIMEEAYRIHMHFQEKYGQEVPNQIYALFAKYDTTNGKFDMTFAGHPPVKIVRPDENKVITFVGKGVPIGIDREVHNLFPYQRETIELMSGDRVFFISDGVQVDQETLDAYLLSSCRLPINFAVPTLLHSLTSNPGDPNDATIGAFGVLRQPFRDRKFSGDGI